MLFWLAFGWASNLVAVWVTSLIFDGVTYDDKFWVLVVAGLVLFLANAIIRPIVIILTLPAVILTLGLGFYLYPISFFIVAGLYFALTLGSERQATPGMQVMDLAMERDDGRRIDFGIAMVHVLAFWIINSLLTPFLLLVGLFTERRRLIHDMLLGTYMVRASAKSY